MMLSQSGWKQYANGRGMAVWVMRVLMTWIVAMAGLALLGGGIAPGGAAVVEAQAVAPSAMTAPAPLISYQGRLVDPATGLPKPDGSYGMSFRLYGGDVGGAPLYTELRPNVNVVRSIFSILLGEVAPLDPNLFNGQPLFLGITVGGDPEMAPRIRLAHAPYAIYAERAGAANSVADNVITSAKIADGNVTAADIAANAVDGARVADGSIGSADIQDLVRNVSFPAQALNVNAGSTIITAFAGSFGGGWRWQANAANIAFLNMARPVDWDGASDVTFSVYLYPVTGGAGNIDFFIRPRSYDPGDQHNDVASVSSVAPVPAAGDRVIREQQFNIPRASLQKSLWVVGMQRQGSGETFAGDVAVLAVKMTYNAVR